MSTSKNEELPDWRELELTPDERDALREAVLGMISDQDTVRWARLRMQGSAHADSEWYRKRRLPELAGYQNEIASVLSANGLRGFRLVDESIGLNVDVYIVDGERSTLSRSALLDLGVSPEVIAKATTKTRYTSVVVRQKEAG